ncbi:MAG TPA: histidinol-phosphate transaminase [Acidimicrobiales bacterium]|nr:histidinol-phosphate transaminase [Acidimicrobiales bacterium]
MTGIPAMRADLGLGEGYHSPQVEAAVRLNTNESPFPPPAEWAGAVNDELRAVAWHRYPDRGAWALRKAIAAFHGVAPEQVWCANGSNEVLQTLLLAYGGAGRSAAVWEPTYALHRHIAELTATPVVEGRRGDDLTLDMGEVRRLIEAAQPTVTFLCSPNNPTGEAVGRDVVAEVLERAPGLVVVDEAYGQFAPWSAAELLDERSGLVITRTYSKTWSLAGLRLGYCLAPTQVVAALERASLPYHLDAFTQIAGRLALDYAEDMERRVATIKEERGRLVARLCELPVDVWRSDANFVLFRPRRLRGDDVWRGLLDRSVLVRNCSSWEHLTDCLRVTVGTGAENDAFLTALGEVLA